MKTKMIITGLLALAFCLPTALAQDEKKKKDGAKKKGPPSKEQILKRFDKDGDGGLSKEELGKMHEKMAARLLKAGDKDGDGALSKKEFDALELPKRKAGEGGKKKGGRVQFSEKFERRVETPGVFCRGRDAFPKRPAGTTPIAS
jgi:hypothetical protein